ncbi:MAG: hypothetical protein U1E48_07510 [Paracoccaceae bacterium]
MAIADIAGGKIADYGLIAAAGVLAALPPLLIGMVMQRAIVAGLTGGGGKMGAEQRMDRPAGLIAIEAEMARQAGDARASFAQAGARADEVAASLRRTGRLTMLGMGASHRRQPGDRAALPRVGAGRAGAALSEQLGLGVPLAGKTVLVVSQSGESAEVLRWIETAKWAAIRSA